MVYVYEKSQLTTRSYGSAGVVGKFSNAATNMLDESLQVAFYQEISLHWLLRDEPGFARVYGYSD